MDMQGNILKIQRIIYKLMFKNSRFKKRKNCEKKDGKAIRICYWKERERLKDNENKPRQMQFKSVNM